MRLFKRGREAKGPAREVTLQDAVREGLIEFDLSGVDEGVTSRVNLRVKKLTDDEFTLVVPKGTEFIPVLREERDGD